MNRFAETLNRTRDAWVASLVLVSIYFGIGHSTQGITGIVGVLHAELDAQGLPAISMQVGVPHYAAGTPNPKASMALLRNLEHVTGIPTGHTALTEQAEQWERLVGDAIAENPEAGAYIPQLEARYDQQVAAQMPTGEDLGGECKSKKRELPDDPLDG